MVEQKTVAPKISFGVKRKEENTVQVPSKIVVDVEVDSDEEREREEAELAAKRRKLTHFQEGSVIGDEDPKKEAVVIPMVIEHDWRTQKLLEKEKEGTLTDEEKAKLALLVSSTSTNNDDSNTVTDSKIVVEGENEEAEDADYSAIPIESFGLAILRGCNWKDGDGIGKNPQKVTVRLPNRRPPGLGLGATPKNDTNQKNGKSNGGKDEEVGEIKVGSCIRIVDGRSKGLYGKVEGKDEDSSSLFVRLAIGARTVKVSQFAAVAVSKKEYDKDSKCLNKNEYDKEKEKIEKFREEQEKRGDDREKASTSKNESSKKEEDDEDLWARTDLLVRFIDKSYKSGRLYNEKVRIVDVAGRKDVTIEDDRGTTYYNIKQSWIETVIPRNNGEQIMIVGGRRKGQLAIMIEKDKKKEKVTARLVANNEIVSAYFENVCAVKIGHEEDYD